VAPAAVPGSSGLEGICRYPEASCCQQDCSSPAAPINHFLSEVDPLCPASHRGGVGAFRARELLTVHAQITLARFITWDRMYQGVVGLGNLHPHKPLMLKLQVDEMLKAWLEGSSKKPSQARIARDRALQERPLLLPRPNQPGRARPLDARPGWFSLRNRTVGHRCRLNSMPATRDFLSRKIGLLDSSEYLRMPLKRRSN